MQFCNAMPHCFGMTSSLPLPPTGATRISTYTFTADEFGSVPVTVTGLSAQDMRASLARIREAHQDNAIGYREYHNGNGTVTVGTGFGLWVWAPEGT